MTTPDTYKHAIVTLTSIVMAVVTTIPFAFVLLFAIVMDCLSAFDLSRRLRKKYPERVTGKFRSEYALKMLKTFLEMYSVILLVHFVEVFILPMHAFNLANYAAAACCCIQLWSVLENASSENGKSWAKTLQKIMVNKAERHFDITLDELKKKEEKDENRS